MPTVTTYPGVFGPYTPITFTRASTATYFDSTGTLQSAAIDAPRLDYNPSTLAALGFLVEESRTNSIRNNTMVGAVAPSTFPTNWQSIIVAGLTSTVVGTGTLNGITYLDVRVNGTPSISSYYNLVSDILVAGSSGQTWTGSFWAALVGGSLSNTNANIEIRESDASQGFLTNTLTLLSITSSLARYSQARTLNNASTAFVSVRFVWQVTAGQPVDFTFRIGLPQLELGAFATSVIPTTTTALTRAADVASVNTLSPWYNAAEGTLYSETQQAQDRTAGFPVTAGISDSASGVNTIEQYWNNSTNSLGLVVYVSSSLQAAIQNSGLTRTNVQKVASAYKVNDFASTVGGGTVQTDTSGTIPVVDRLTFGARPGGGLNINGWVRRFTYYPRRLSNAELQALTV